MPLPKIQFAGGGERGQYLTHKGNDTTIRFVLNYPGLLDPHILRQATKALVESVDILHGSFFTDVNSAYWRINEDMDETHYFQYVRTAGDPFPTAVSLSTQPMQLNGKAQLHCTLIQSDSASSLLLRVSHLVVDGGDGKYLLNKLVEAYGMIEETGSAESIQIKNGKRHPEQIYSNMSIKDVMGLMKLPISRGATSAYPFPTEDEGWSNAVYATISRETMTAARRRAKEFGASANDLLLAAAYQIYAALPEVDRTSPISISSMMDLRRHCPDGESAALCNLSGSLPTALVDGVPENFEDTLAQISAQTAAVKDDPFAGMTGLPLLHGIARGIPVWMQMMAADKAYGAMPVGLTNLGNLNCSAYALGGLVPTGGIFGGPLKKKPGMQISIISFDGECVLATYGRMSDDDCRHVQNTLNAMAQVICDFANP